MPASPLPFLLSKKSQSALRSALIAIIRALTVRMRAHVSAKHGLCSTATVKRRSPPWALSGGSLFCVGIAQCKATYLSRYLL